MHDAWPASDVISTPLYTLYTLHCIHLFGTFISQSCRATYTILLYTDRSIPRQYCHSLFSALAPDTTVRPHHGPTNKKLRCHLPLVVPAGGACTLTVGGECRTLEEGKCVIFDDSFLHEASNSSLGGDERGEPRVVLIVDVWHPDLTDTEVGEAATVYYSLVLIVCGV